MAGHWRGSTTCPSYCLNKTKRTHEYCKKKHKMSRKSSVEFCCRRKHRAEQTVGSALRDDSLSLNPIKRKLKTSSQTSSVTNIIRCRHDVLRDFDAGFRLSCLTYLLRAVRHVAKSLLVATPSTCYSAVYVSQTRDRKRFTIPEVAADWHELMIPQRNMRPSIARAIEQLAPRCSTQTHHRPVGHTRPSPSRRKLLVISHPAEDRTLS